MDARDVSRILMKAAAYDLRTVGEGDILAWHEALHDVDLDDALTAVARHYRDTNERLMPADVRSIVAEIRRERIREANSRRAIAAAERDAIGRGPVRDRSADVTALVRQVADALPTPRTDRIHQRAQLRARREHGRPEQTPPRPPRGRRKDKDWPPPQSDEIASLATRYLIDGYPPADVAERLGVSRKWLQHTNRRMRPAGPASQPEESL